MIKQQKKLFTCIDLVSGAFLLGNKTAKASLGFVTALS